MRQKTIDAIIRYRFFTVSAASVVRSFQLVFMLTISSSYSAKLSVSS